MKKWTTLTALAVLGASATSFALRGQSDPVAKKMASPVSFDQKIAPLQVQNTAGKPVTIGQWNKSKATVLMFVSTNCPVSNAYNTRMAGLQTNFAPQGVRFIGINSNKAESGSDVAAHAKQNGFGFAVYKDPQNKVADRFEAKVTPEVYVVGPKGNLLYKGRIDNSQNESEVNDRSLQTALKTILAGKTVTEKETRAFGCSIKREN